MKIARPLLFLLAAAILILASLGAGKTVREGLKEERVMSGGRRVSTLVDRERKPDVYWMVIGFNGLMAAGLSAAGVWMGVKAFMPRKERNTTGGR